MTFNLAKLSLFEGQSESLFELINTAPSSSGKTEAGFLGYIISWAMPTPSLSLL